MLFGFLFQFWCCRLGSTAWGLYPTLLRGNILAAEISLQHFSCYLWEPSQTSPPQSLPVLWWWHGFFCLSIVIRLLSSQCSAGYSGWFLSNFVLIPVWSWRRRLVKLPLTSLPSWVSTEGFLKVRFFLVLLVLHPSSLKVISSSWTIPKSLDISL